MRILSESLEDVMVASSSFSFLYLDPKVAHATNRPCLRLLHVVTASTTDESLEGV